MKGFTIRAIMVIAVTLSLVACSSLDKILPVVEAPTIENQRASIAMSSLKELETIDAYIRLDNSLLGDQISNGLKVQAAATNNFEFAVDTKSDNFLEDVATIGFDNFENPGGLDLATMEAMYNNPDAYGMGYNDFVDMGFFEKSEAADLASLREHGLSVEANARSRISVFDFSKNINCPTKDITIKTKDQKEIKQTK